VADYDCRVNRLAMLALEQDGFAAAVEGARERYGAARIGVFLGTSTSGILDTELATRAALQAGGAPSFDAAFYPRRHSMFAPVLFVREYLGLRGMGSRSRRRARRARRSSAPPRAPCGPGCATPRSWAARIRSRCRR
jgi:hypothetical protein